ncbi:hypothetical protein JTB14_032358 [Gonioctena quinquepunctata]|nr:hypothetical protein JTB14_032358 [Gonioctena quinquepunctata]
MYANTTNTSLNPDLLNSYFCSISKTLSQNIVPPHDPLEYLSDIYVDSTFSLYTTNINELKEVIGNIKNKKASGIDEISIKIFESLPETALNILVKLINNSFAQGTFPSFLKTSVVIPLHKGGNKEDPANFRPISLIPTLAKIIEKLVKKRMMEFFNRNRILSAHQYGFQNFKSTSDAISTVLQMVYNEINSGEATAAVLCDLSKQCQSQYFASETHKIWF